jgi:hypothetical protein
VNPQHAQPELWQQAAAAGAGQAWVGQAFALEDDAEAREVLFRRYAAVVGNPPYITEKDPAKREVYRKMYVSAAGKYALSAPFCERFFQLCRDRGYCGQITANSFMKREFGKKLIEEYLPTVNLELIVNTSGAYIPGHGTPTVLLFGTNEPASKREVLAGARQARRAEHAGQPRARARSGERRRPLGRGRLRERLTCRSRGGARRPGESTRGAWAAAGPAS